MGIKRPVDFRFPEREASFTQGGVHEHEVRSYQTGIDISNKRGTMYLRISNGGAGNAYNYLRVTIDGVAYPIQIIHKYTGLDAWWIFDFNESVLAEHYISAYMFSRIEYAYYEYRP